MSYRVVTAAPNEFGYVDPRGSFLSGLGKIVSNVGRGLLGMTPIGGALNVAKSIISTGKVPSGPAGALQVFGGINPGSSALTAMGLNDHPASTIGSSDHGTPALPPQGALPALPALNVSAAPNGVVTQSPLGTPVHPAAIARQMRALQGGAHRRRHMRWSNTKALSRAERRIHSAVKHFSKYMRLVHPHHKGHYVAKFGGKKHGR